MIDTGLLTEDQEQHLAERIQAGDAAAVQIITETNYRFAYWLAGKHARKFSIPYDECRSMALYALAQAARKYKPDAGRFAHHVKMQFKQECKREYRTRKPITCRDPKQISFLYLDAPQIDTAGKQFSKELPAPDPEEPRPYRGILPVIRKLKFHERLLLFRVFWRRMQLSQIGSLYGVSGESIRRMKEKALKNLRVLLAADQATAEI